MRIEILGFALALGLSGISTAANAVSVYLQPVTQDVDVGATFSVAVWWDMSPEGTLGGGTDVTWDPAALDFVSLVFDDNSDFDPAFTREGTVSPGLIDGFATGTFEDGGLAGDGPLLIATITFEALTEGSFSIDLSEDVGGIAGVFVSAETFQPFGDDISFTGGTVNVGGGGAIPVPAAAWLMLSGLGALFGYRRKS
jgi:hypothetical protein